MWKVVLEAEFKGIEYEGVGASVYGQGIVGKASWARHPRQDILGKTS